jgi:hypothetical protein
LQPRPASSFRVARRALGVGTRAVAGERRAELVPRDREILHLADAVEAGITGGHIFLEDGRVVTWEMLTPGEPEWE